ncbi:MAG: hypothetical protein ACRBF0_17750 [Calditrichia bacterium]
MSENDLKFRSRKKTAVYLFANTAEAITFWACVTGLFFLALLYTFKYLTLDKTTVPLEKVEDVRREMNGEIDELKLANGRLVLQLEALQRQLGSVKNQLSNVNLQVDSLQLPSAADSTTIAQDSLPTPQDSLANSWAIDPRQTKLTFEVPKSTDSGDSSRPSPATSDSWAPVANPDTFEVLPMTPDSVGQSPAETSDTSRAQLPDSSTSSVLPDSSSVPTP